MALEKITFDHFFIEVKGHIDKNHIVLINPNTMNFFKLDNIYLALSVPNNKLVVNFSINTGKGEGGDWRAELLREATRSKLDGIIFYTSENNKIVQNIAKKWKMKQIDTIPDFYSDGDAAFVYEYLISKTLYKDTTLEVPHGQVSDFAKRAD